MLGSPIVGAPGVSATYTAAHRKVFSGVMLDHYLSGGKTIDGSKSRDPGNGDITVLRPGVLLGKITSGGFYAPSCFGVLTNAEAQGSTQLETTAAAVTEIVRRIGASGTLKVTGPPTANGTARTLTFTYSAASSTNITVTAVGANQVEDIRFNVASTAGNLQLRVQKADGTFATTANIAWNATDATYLAAINSALDTTTGVSGAIVATAISAVDPDLGFRLTYSGTGYAGQTFTKAQVALFPTSSTWAYYEAITTAVDGRFVAGSLIQPTDGSETPTTFVPDGWGIKVTDVLDGTGATNVYAQMYRLPISGEVETTRFLPAFTDTGIIAYVKASLNGANSPGFVFKDMF